MEPVEEYQTPKSVITPLGKVDSPYRRKFCAPPPSKKKFLSFCPAFSAKSLYRKKEEK